MREWFVRKNSKGGVREAEERSVREIRLGKRMRGREEKEGMLRKNVAGKYSKRGKEEGRRSEERGGKERKREDR